jgi:glucose/mannose-6-phosphate isomerase
MTMLNSDMASTILDDPAAMGRADTQDMLGSLAGFCAQVREGWRISRKIELPWATPTSIVIIGMGGSAIGADLVKGIWADRISVPVEVVRGYELPAWVGTGTLVIASSKSGNTEETLSALEAALSRRCPVVVISTGGTLKTVAEATGLPFATFPAAGSPRAAVGYSMAIVAGVLERAGVLDLDEAEIEAAVGSGETMAARCAPDVPTSDNPAKQLAWSLVDRLAIVSGGGFLAPVARRWKTQLNENAKTTAAFDELPEMTHNSIVGFEQPDSLRDHLFVILLQSDLDHRRNEIRARLTGDLLETAHISHEFVSADGASKLGQALAMIVLGDHLSVYVAFTYAVDPTPIGVIDHIKQQLALADQTDPQ